MMWEWRIFWSTSVSCSGFDEPDIFLLLQRGRISNESPRRDDYVAVTSDIGLKWRGGRELEVKIRKEVDEASGAERWQKVYRDKVPKPANSSNLKQAVLDVVKTLSRRMGSQQQFEDASKAIQEDSSVKCLGISKERRTSYFGHCALEQTEIHMSDKHYRSVSIEADQVADIVRLLQTQVHYNGKKSTLREVLIEKGKDPRGYPEFVMQLQ